MIDRQQEPVVAGLHQAYITVDTSSDACHLLKLATISRFAIVVTRFAIWLRVKPLPAPVDIDQRGTQLFSLLDSLDL